MTEPVLRFSDSPVLLSQFSIFNFYLHLLREIKELTMPEIVNPAVIIGLGGTGKWVLTYVKKNLLDTYGGEMPKTVRLLSFDTTSEKVSRDGVPQEEDARVGNVQLDKQAEFVYLGGNIQQ